MEAHPVPQNVTAFEFHLIGDMSIKQFSYLAVGMTIAYVTYLLFFSLAPWVAGPIIAISSLTGIAFAFIPIQDRPLDHWAKAFFKAIYSPTKTQWKLSNKKDGSENLAQKDRLEIYYQQVLAPMTPANQPRMPQGAAPAPTPTPQRKEEPKPVQSAPRPGLNKLTPQRPSATVVTQPGPEALPTLTPKKEVVPTDDQLTKTVELAKEAQLVQLKIVEAEKQINYLKSAATVPGSKPATYNLELQKVFENLQTLIQHAQQVSQQLAESNIKEGESGLPTGVKASEVKEIKPTAPKKNLPVLTSSPNVINGIVMDATGNYLENVVVVIHNHDGLPVRALKSNKLGQFTGATPLPAGPYTITLEKDQMNFDTLKVTLNDQVLPPIEVAAKKEGVVAG